MLKPTSDNVVLVRVAPPERPRTVAFAGPRPASQWGVVLATGPCVASVAKGDLVCFGKWGGAKLRIGEQELLSMPEGDLLAKVEQ